MPSAHTFWAAGLGTTLLLATRAQYNKVALINASKYNVLEISAYIACIVSPLIAVERVLSREHTIMQAVVGLLLGVLYSIITWEPAVYLTNPISCSLDTVISCVAKGKKIPKN